VREALYEWGMVPKYNKKTEKMALHEIVLIMLNKIWMSCTAAHKKTTINHT
jgi:hypothetical protein